MSNHYDLPPTIAGQEAQAVPYLATTEQATNQPIYPWTEGHSKPPEETRLIAYFEELLSMHPVKESMIPINGKPIAHPERFRYAPLVNYSTSLSLFISEYIPPADPSVMYASFGPYLDTRQAIGLVYDNALIAVGGAGVDASGRLQIVQLQDVTGVQKSDGKTYFKRCCWRTFQTGIQVSEASGRIGGT